MAVAGVGGGLGLLARKMLRNDREPLGSVFDGGGRERAAAAAAAAAEARNEAARVGEILRKSVRWFVAYVINCACHSLLRGIHS